MADSAAAAVAPMNVDGPKPAKSKHPKKARFPALRFFPPVVQCRGHSFYHCQATMAQIKKRAGLPVKQADGTWRLLGSFMDFNVAADYVREARDAGSLTDEQYEEVLSDIKDYIGAENLDLPSQQAKNINAFDGNVSLGDFQKSYTKKRVAADKYRTPEQDRQEQEVRKLKKAQQATEVPAAEQQARLPLQLFSSEKNVGGVRSISDLLAQKNSEDAGNRLHAWLVAAVPAEKDRYAAKRIQLDNEKDQDLIQCVSAGLPKVPRLAGLPQSNSAGRKPLLIVSRSTAKELAASASSGSDASPPVQRKRKNSESAAAEESAKPAKKAENAEKPKAEKPKKAEKTKHEAQSPSPPKNVKKEKKESSPAEEAAAKKEAKPAKKEKSASPASESGSGSASPSKKPRKPLTEEQKKARKERIAAKKAAAAVPAAAN